MSEALYPIRAVAKLTGVPLDTIRAWERRYRAVTPQRDARGRLYSESEVQRLMLLRDAVTRGHSIGQVANFADDDLRRLLRESEDLLEPGLGKRRKLKASDSVLGPLLKALEAFDYVGAERELNRLAAATADPRNIVHEIALPLMRVTGERWHEGRFTIAQEHMVTVLLSGLLASLLRAYGNPNPPAKVLLATPEGEHHGFGVLAAAMLTAVNGLGAIHLGTNLPAREIVQAARRTEAKAILIGICGAKADSVLTPLQEIRKGAAPRTQLWVGGATEDLVPGLLNASWIPLKDFSALERELQLLVTQS